MLFFNNIKIPARMPSSDSGKINLLCRRRRAPASLQAVLCVLVMRLTSPPQETSLARFFSLYLRHGKHK
jgi:hypothetical protein